MMGSEQNTGNPLHASVPVYGGCSGCMPPFQASGLWRLYVNTVNRNKMESFDDLLSDAPSLCLDSFKHDEDSIEPLNPRVSSCVRKIECTWDDEKSLRGDIRNNDDTGREIESQSKLKKWLNTWWLFVMTILGYRVQNLPNTYLQKPTVDRIIATPEVKKMMREMVETRMYGLTDDVEAVIREYLQKNSGKLPTVADFRSTWATMRGTKGIVKLQEEKEAEKRKRVTLEMEKEAEKREKEAEKRKRVRLEMEKEAEKREKEAEKWKRVRLEVDMKEKNTRISVLERKLQEKEENKFRSN